jgi:hypothetical protein
MGGDRVGDEVDAVALPVFYLVVSVLRGLFLRKKRSQTT